MPRQSRVLEVFWGVAVGAGAGIERFVPRRGKLEISKNMVVENLATVLDLPPQTLEALAGAPAAGDAAVAAAGRTAWRPWSVEEMEAGECAPAAEPYIGL